MAAGLYFVVGWEKLYTRNSEDRINPAMHSELAEDRRAQGPPGVPRAALAETSVTRGRLAVGNRIRIS